MSEVSANGASGGKSRPRTRTLFAAMFLFCFLLRLPLLLFPPAGFYYSMARGTSYARISYGVSLLGLQQGKSCSDGW